MTGPFCSSGGEPADVTPVNEAFSFAGSPRQLYDILLTLWSAGTCAPRMRGEWSPENPSRGQCSITAFLAQDIYGGEVRGVPLPDGNYHCFNVVGTCYFDLTSGQFTPGTIDYTNACPQSRDVHFAKEEKRLRYEALKAALLATRS